MLTITTSKVNLGLNILRKRPDGYHDVQTVMARIDWGDILEAVKSVSEEPTLSATGYHIECPFDRNLVIKALRAFEEATGGRVNVDVFLHKIVPDGAGLGGGSADAAYMLHLLNKMNGEPLPVVEMAESAAKIGADCPFFVYGETAMLATGTGTELSPIALHPSVRQHTLVVAKPAGVSVSTKDAYAGVIPSDIDVPDIAAIVSVLPPGEWASAGLRNDFESSIFPRFPQVAELKNEMLRGGASYAAMSGSGAAVFGLFDGDKMADRMMQRLSGLPCHKGNIV